MPLPDPRLVADPGGDGGTVVDSPLLSKLLAALPWQLALPMGFFGWPLLEHLLTEDLEERDPKIGSWQRHQYQMTPKDLVQELSASEEEISKDRGEMAQRVLELQDWRRQMQPRLRLLEQHLAWKVLGITQTSDTSVIGKAFKRRALELHPDKGGDHEKFQLLQDMKGLLIPDDVASKPPRKQREPKDDKNGDDTDEEIEQLIRARQQVEEKEETSTIESAQSLSGTRVKLHQAVLLAWHRFQDLGRKLAEFEQQQQQHEQGAEVHTTFQRFVSNFSNDGSETQQVQQFLMEGADVLLAAALLDVRATSSHIAEVFGNKHLGWSGL